MDVPVILLVEDDPQEARALRLVLGRAAVHVELASTHGEAMAVLMHMRSPPLAGAIVDLVLPDGDGFEIVRHLRDRWPRLLVLVTTGLCSPEVARRVFDLDARYLVKPYAVAQITDFAARVSAGAIDPVGARLQAAATTIARRSRLPAEDVAILFAAAVDDRRAEIQRAVGVGLATLKRRLERIFEQTGADDLRHLGAMVRQLAVEWPQPPR